MKRTAIVLLLLSWVSLAQGQTPPNRVLPWFEERIDSLYYIVLGTPKVAEHGVNGAIIAPATVYVTELLPVPEGTEFAEVTIRSGSESATILSASQVSGAIGADFIQDITLAYFTRAYDARLFGLDIQNDRFSGNVLLHILDTIYDASGMVERRVFQPVNGSAGDDRPLNAWGTYRFPFRAGYLVFKFSTPPDPLIVNRIGQFLSVRFIRSFRP